jgi:stage V sporulation protein D (sporulation-specific penicillin-binding protein)
VGDALEPGSTFKILTLAAGLDAGVINVNSTFHCNGYRIVEGQKIKCWSARPHGTETLYEGVQKSCNPVFMDIALKLGRDRFYEYIYAFGLGSQMGIDLNGEGTGIVTSPKYVRDIDLARIGFGQSIAVTPLQLITASAAAINGGSLMRPYVVKEVTTQDGAVIANYGPEKIGQVIKPETSAIVRDILKSVVEQGSGKNARISGYEVGGKTGTAQKYGADGRIMQSRHIASFIAFAPVEKPKYIILVIVDEPNVAVDFGSIVAAPYARMILEDTLKCTQKGSNTSWRDTAAPWQTRYPSPALPRPRGPRSWCT